MSILKIPILSASILFLITFVSCGDSLLMSSNDLNTTKPTPTPLSLNIMEISEDVFLNKEGWRVPPLKEKLSHLSETLMKDGSGKKQSVSVNVYVLEEFYTSEPYSLIGIDYGQFKVDGVKEFIKGDRIFAYLLTARRMDSDRKMGNANPVGLSFHYAFYDKDGDGIFESLLRNPGFDLIVPDWVVVRP